MPVAEKQFNSMCGCVEVKIPGLNSHITTLTCTGLVGGHYVILAKRNGKCILFRQILCLSCLFMKFKKPKLPTNALLFLCMLHFVFFSIAKVPLPALQQGALTKKRSSQRSGLYTLLGIF